MEDADDPRRHGDHPVAGDHQEHGNRLAGDRARRDVTVADRREGHTPVRLLKWG